MKTPTLFHRSLFGLLCVLLSGWSSLRVAAQSCPPLSESDFSYSLVQPNVDCNLPGSVTVSYRNNVVGVSNLTYAFGTGAEGVGEIAHPDDVVAIAHRDAAREVAIDIGLHEAVAEIALRERGATLRGYAKTAPTAQQDAKQSEKTAMEEGGCFHLKTENELKLGDCTMRPHGGVL